MVCSALFVGWTESPSCRLHVEQLATSGALYSLYLNFWPPPPKKQQLKLSLTSPSGYGGGGRGGGVTEAKQQPRKNRSFSNLFC